MKEMLREVYQSTKKVSGVDPSKPGNMKQVLTDDNAFETYVKGLSEGIENQQEKENFELLAENTRVNLLENSMYQINPYESLVLPILRVFYPKLVAKEAVTVSPMDRPESVKAFLRAQFSPSKNSSWYNAPSTNQDISGGPKIGTPVYADMPVPANSFDVLALAGTNSTECHLERDFEIVVVSSDGTNFTSVSPIIPAVEGHFSQSVSLDAGDDVISGKVDYLNGTVDVASTTGVVTYVKFKVTCSLEENQINPAVELNVDKVRLYAKDRQITANWTINMEQDMRALFDLSMQAEVVNILGQQIALDIDREIVNSLISGNQKLNGASHTDSFSRTPPSEFNWGPKYWHENILPVLNKLSAQVYNDTNIDAANTILANPLDVSILEDLQGFNYTGTSTMNGDMGYRSATVAGGKWRVLTSAVVQQGKMVLVHRPTEELKCTYLYCPYVPAILHPYPLGHTPSLTILSRYASSMVRANGIATVNITS